MGTDEPADSSAQEDDLPGGHAGEPGALKGIHEQREVRWIDEMRWISEDRGRGAAEAGAWGGGACDVMSACGWSDRSDVIPLAKSTMLSDPLELNHITPPSGDSEKLEPTKIHDREDVEYPRGMKLALIVLALCLSVFLVALDNTIIATAIPKITDQFNSLADVGWYGSAYLLTTSAFQLLFGRFYSILSLKWVYVAAIVIFELGSLICGVAQNSTTLIVGRAIAGLGSSGIFSGALIIIANSAPLERRPMFSGIIGSMYGMASVAGPLLGGAFTDKVTWRWCFYINLPLGAVTLLTIVIFFKSPPRVKARGNLTLVEKIRRFDPVGTLVFVPAIICLLLALQWGGSRYAWSNGRIIALFVVAALLLSVFVAVQIREQENATVPPRILQQRSILAGAWFMFFTGASYFLLVYYLPLWFQAIKGVSAVKSGIDNLPLIMSLVVASLIAGVLVSVTGYYTPFAIAASVLIAIGAGLISTFTPTTGHAHWIGYQVVYGLGMGCGTQQPILAAQAVLKIEDVPTGTAVMAFLQVLGGALGVSISQNVFTNTLISRVASRAPNVSVSTVIHAGATNLRTAVPAADLPGVLLAYNDALMAAIYVSVATGALSVFGALALEWKSVKKRPSGDVDAGG
ncbi:unnamed protein product [Mycena citricolor]|uniref:Major facilitator superfamily (MFS) profile domain-containing protein n=1 Tax=Mycena citricolor TaxID=2018698 RepID=A0AAD2HI47_9AGAR|nr:unnamed protein product [Mycena citricolor]